MVILHHTQAQACIAPLFAKVPKSAQLTCREWDLVAAFVTLLKPLYEATLEMSGAKYTTNSLVIIMMKSLPGWYAAKERELQHKQANDIEIKLCSQILQNLICDSS